MSLTTETWIFSLFFEIFDQNHNDTNSSEEECYTKKHSLMGRKKKIIFDLNKMEDLISLLVVCFAAL